MSSKAVIRISVFRLVLRDVNDAQIGRIEPGSNALRNLMSSFWGEIRRRKAFQVATTYAVVAWLLVQIVVTVEEPLARPSWVDTFVIVSLAIGFPITLILSWASDLTSEGFVRDQSAPIASSSSGRRLEYALISFWLWLSHGSYVEWRSVHLRLAWSRLWQKKIFRLENNSF